MTATESFFYGDKNFSVKTKKRPEIKRFQATRKPDDIIPTRCWASYLTDFAS